MKSSAGIACCLLLGTLGMTASTNKVLIIGVDGAMCSALAVARTPNLDGLKSNGCYSVRVVTHPVTHSAACWSSMFTGVWGDKHLVNDPNNSFTGNNFAAYPSFFKHLEDADASLNTFCFARWSPLITVVPDADVKTAFSSDAAITAETCRILTNSNPDVLYTILLDVDSAGHNYGWGPDVAGYVRAIEAADGRVGEILAALRGRATYDAENWLVIALTDHGEHDHPDPERSRVTWHIVSGPSAARGVMWPSPSIVDLCATVLTHMGVAIDPGWKLDARIEGLPLSPVRYETNLIFNGNAEATSGTGSFATNRGIAWWFDTGSITLGAYGGNPLFPTSISPGPQERGRGFFLGGTADGMITQRIELSALADDIDDPGVDYLLSGWFGGAGTDEDYATLATDFLDGYGAVLGVRTIGNVTAAERAGTTGLWSREADGTLPPGTRFVEFVLTARVGSGNNDASADDLSFILIPRPDEPFAISMATMEPNGRRIELAPTRTNRLYTLHRSSDLAAWLQVTEPVAGTGGALLLSDTNAPNAATFYRVSSQRPQ